MLYASRGIMRREEGVPQLAREFEVRRSLDEGPAVDSAMELHSEVL